MSLAPYRFAGVTLALAATVVGLGASAQGGSRAPGLYRIARSYDGPTRGAVLMETWSGSRWGRVGPRIRHTDATLRSTGNDNQRYQLDLIVRVSDEAIRARLAAAGFRAVGNGHVLRVDGRF